VDVYSARISPSATVAEGVSYDVLVDRIREYTLHAAFARVADRHDWEQEELRRNGLRALELFHDGSAVWHDAAAFDATRADESRSGGLAAFDERNELDPELEIRLDRDLRERWRIAGYLVASLTGDMKRLFEELETDARDCAEGARAELLAELLRGCVPP
jgi:hypothetical protein